MRVYTHFTLSEREYLEAKLKEGKSFRQIAKALGRSPSANCQAKCNTDLRINSTGER